MGYTQNETKTHILWGNGIIELGFCKQTGRWDFFKDAVQSRNILENGRLLSSIIITTDGITTYKRGREQLWSIKDAKSSGEDLKLVGYKTEEKADSSCLMLELNQGHWFIQDIYMIQAGTDVVERKVNITWNGDDETLVRWVELRTPSVACLDNCILEAPGYPDIIHQPLGELPAGQWEMLCDIPDKDVPNYRPGLMVIQSPENNLMLWGFNEEIPSMMLVYRTEWGVYFYQKQYSCCRMNKGDALNVGSQYCRISHADLMTDLKTFNGFWKDNDISLNGHKPEWAKEALIYEVVVGPKSFAKSGQTYEPYPDIHSVTRDLPRIAGLGFNTLELMPKFPYPNYSIHDYYDIDTHYSPVEDLKLMIDTAHELGIKVLIDVIMHGVTDKTLNPRSVYGSHPLLDEKPHWFLRTEDGKTARTYTWAFDHANPDFQDYMVEVFKYYTKTLDVDGYRVDALTWNFFPNWASGLGRKGYKSFYASCPLFERVRKEVQKIKPDTVFYTETAGPLFNKCFELSYNYDEHWLFECLLPVASKRGHYPLKNPKTRQISAVEMAEWMEMRNLALPDHTCRVHHADSHDSHEWGGYGMFRNELFGIQATRLLFAFCNFIDGAVMNFAGAEKDSEDYYRRVLELRKSIPALSKGSCEYTLIRPDNSMIFAPFRKYKSQWAIPILSFAQEDLVVKLPLNIPEVHNIKNYVLLDVSSGEKSIINNDGNGFIVIEMESLSVKLLMPE